MPAPRFVNVLSSSTAELIAPARARTPVPPDPVAVSRPSRGSTGGRFYVVLAAVALVIAALSLLLPSTPSYDPWAWLVWGREIVHLRLHTIAGPSWKPLPVIFTTLFAPLGNAAPDLWLVVARAGAVMAAVMCFKVAWRLTGRLLGVRAGAGSRAGAAGSRAGAAGESVVPAHIGQKRRSSGLIQRASGARGVGSLLPLLAGAIAAGSFINAPNVLSGNALGYSEGLLTALAVDRARASSRRASPAGVRGRILRRA